MYHLLISTLLLCGAVLSAAEVTIEDLDTELKFEDTLKQNPDTFVLFYRGGQDVQLSEYEKAVRELQNTNVKFAKANLKKAKFFYVIYKELEDSTAIFYYKKQEKSGSLIGPMLTPDIVNWVKSMISEGSSSPPLKRQKTTE